MPPSGVPPSGGPPPGPPPLSRLTRSTQDKVVSGLCGGLGRHFAIDPIVIRVAFVVLTLAGGTGILLYLVGWALIPDDQGGVIGGGVGGKAPLRWVGEDRSRKLVAAVVAGGGLLILLNQITDGSDGDVALGLCLVVLGAAFLWSRRNAGKLPPGTGSGPVGTGPPPGGGTWVVPPMPPSDTTGPPSDTDAPTADPAPDPSPSAAGPPAAGDDTAAESPTGSAAVEIDPSTPPASSPAGSDPLATTTAPMPLAAWPPQPPYPGVLPPAPVPPAAVRLPKPPRPPKPRSVLVAVTCSVLAIQAGVLVLAGASLVTGLALSVLVVGLALVVGTWMGRARWLIPVGLLLSIALGAAVVLDVPVSGGTGSRVYNVATLSDLRSPYRLGAGEMILDLGNLDLTGTTTEVDASVALGHLVVVVPAGAEVDFEGMVNVGNLVLFGREWDGTSVKQDVVVPGREGGGRLVLDAQMGVGELEVRRAAA